MASRPFASVNVALEAGGDQEELLQVSEKTHTHTQPKSVLICTSVPWPGCGRVTAWATGCFEESLHLRQFI